MEKQQRRQDDDEAPKKGAPLLLLALLGGGLLMLLMLCGGGVIAGYFFFRDVPGGVDNPVRAQANVSKENLRRVESGMTVDEVDAVLGRGRPATDADMRTAFNENRPVPISSTDVWRNNAQRTGVTSWQQWQNGDESIFVGFARGKKTGKDRALLSFWVQTLDKGFISSPGLMELFPVDDPDRIVEGRDERNKIFNDPKFKVGDPKKLIVGRWQDELNTGYEFKADGTYRHHAPGGEPGVYKFTAPDEIELTENPDRPIFGGGRPEARRFKVLVSDATLILSRLPGEGFLETYQRAK